ncbi:lipopolysaccharide heptosyltransferase family protein [Dyella dinghuensis]|uniref:Lipopolysaccharide heptosyltransferase family protein n=1 Tax=Dyella dinghuensis TaxID=1920169 RepID=A0A3S0QVE5_9GAMM|nr:glycosyltransferase family 9 protein [Dyella dinghuensis]RUL61552.1 lipopolysaccharide heptosyltransferase family protein [Dyella dinghuensis]
MSKPIRPLVIRFGRVGDMILLQPLLRRLHARYGEPCELLGIGKHSLELYRDQPDVARVMSLLSHHRPFALSPEQWRVVRALRRMRDVPVYVSEPQAGSLARIRLLLKLAGIPEDHCVFLNDIPLPEAGHWIEHLLTLADATPPAFRDRFEHVNSTSSHVPAFEITAQERADCDRWLAARGLAGHPLVLMQPANKRTMRWNGVRKASDDDKSWPIENWAKVVAAIQAKLPDARILLCGSPAEANYLESIRTDMAQPNVEVVARDLPLPRLRALLAVAHSMISVDTGPAHLAAAMGCPLVVMFGSVAPSHWMQRASFPEAVHALGGPPRSRRVDAIKPDEVIDAWRGLPSRIATASPIRHADTSA